MADLLKIIKLMDIKIDNPAFNNQVSGKKRRYWLTPDDQADSSTTLVTQENNNVIGITAENKTTITRDRSRDKQEIDPGIDQGINRTTRDKQEIHQEINEGATRDKQETDQEINKGIYQEIHREIDRGIQETEIMLISLTGWPKKIFIHILNLCYTQSSITTGPIITRQIALVIGTSYDMIKTSLKSLIKKGLIKRLRGKGCRGGYIVLEIPSVVKKTALLLFKQEIYREIHQGIKPEIYREISDNSSSSLNILKTTTDTLQSNKAQQLSTDWQNIDIEPLSNLGITPTHLVQLASQNKLSAKMVQDSIYAFAFDLKENGKRKDIKGDPVGFFMGILRKGGVYVPPGNYEPPNDHCMRLYTERMGEIEAKRVEIEKKAFDLAFNDWFIQLSDVQKIEFLPQGLRVNPRLEKNKILEGGARDCFAKEVWPNIKNKIISG